MQTHTQTAPDMQTFVYGEFQSSQNAAAAVDALIAAEVQADDVDVLRMRSWGPERMPIEHHRPVVACTLVGLPIGMLIGVAVGFMMASEVDGQTAADAWTVLRFGWLGAAFGAFVGAIAGNGWWRTRLKVDTDSPDDRYFVVGTLVPENRAPDIEEVLRSAEPVRLGRHLGAQGMGAQLHADREVINTP